MSLLNVQYFTPTEFILDVYIWDTTNVPQINQSVNGFLNVNSASYCFNYNQNTNLVQMFTVTFIFSLQSPLNSIDPNQVITLVFPTTQQNPYTPIGSYCLNLSISQSGKRLSSPTYITQLGTDSNNNNLGYIPISNFFSITNTGVYYTLTVTGNLNGVL